MNYWLNETIRYLNNVLIDKKIFMRTTEDHEKIWRKKKEEVVLNFNGHFSKITGKKNKKISKMYTCSPWIWECRIEKYEYSIGIKNNRKEKKIFKEKTFNQKGF